MSVLRLHAPSKKIKAATEAAGLHLTRSSSSPDPLLAALRCHGSRLQANSQQKQLEMVSDKKLVTISLNILVSIDVLANSFSDFFGSSVTSRLSVYTIQDLSLVLSVIIFAMLFFREEVLRRGDLMPLLRSNRVTLVLVSLYFLLTIVLQTLMIRGMNQQFASHPGSWMNDEIVVLLFFSQRFVSTVYYFTFVNTAAGICDCGASRQSLTSANQEAEAGVRNSCTTR